MMRTGHRGEVAATLVDARRSRLAALAALLVSAGLALGGSPPAGARAPELRPERQDAGDPVVVVAGDIADCGAGAAATAALLDDLPGTVLTVGDNVYPAGSAADYRACYEPTWGRHKARTRPSPGNHDYDPPRAAPYFAYFGANAGPEGRGYYSFDLGAWHVVALDYGHPNVAALEADLNAHPSQCLLAFDHAPIIGTPTSTHSSDQGSMFLSTLKAHGVDLILNGHNHVYERGSDGSLTWLQVGTGGIGHYSFTSPVPGSAVRSTTAYGAVKLVLTPAGWTSQYVNAPGSSLTDTAAGGCGA
jgi:acid phosphatase type 7